MDKALKLRIEDAIDEAREASAKFVAVEIGRAVMQVLALEDLERSPMMRDQIALAYIVSMAARSERRAVAAAESLDGWLPFPEFQHIPATVQKDSLECDNLDTLSVLSRSKLRQVQ